MIVPVAGMTHVVENTLNYAKSLSPQQIIGVYVAFKREDEKKFEEKLKKWQPEVRLVTLHSHYRSITNPLTKFVDTVEDKAREGNYQVTVVIPNLFLKRLSQYSSQSIKFSYSSLLTVSKRRGSNNCTLSF